MAAPRQRGDESGLALIAVDGKPARGFKVGAVIDGNLVLQSVHARGAALGPSGAATAVSLELPALPGAVGSAVRLPQSGTGPGAGPIVSMPSSVMPPPPLPGPMPGMRPPEPGESSEPQPVAPPMTGTNTR